MSPATELPVLWQLQVSHFNEKVRWALDLKRIPHRRRSLLVGWHAIAARRLTGHDTTPVLTLDGRSISDSTSIADLTAAALFYPVVRPANFPYPLVGQPPPDAQELLDSLAGRPGGRWVADIYARHRPNPGPAP